MYQRRSGDRRLPQRVTAQWDKRLNAASFENSDNGKQRNWLPVPQRLWIQYRDSNCLGYDLGDGTLRCCGLRMIAPTN